jgi:hypothetical protein
MDVDRVVLSKYLAYLERANAGNIFSVLGTTQHISQTKHQRGKHRTSKHDGPEVDNTYYHSSVHTHVEVIVPWIADCVINNSAYITGTFHYIRKQIHNQNKLLN